MTVARLTTTIGAITGTTPTNAKVLRVGANIYAPTANQNPNATNDEKAGAVLLYVLHVLSALNADGAAAIKAGQQLAEIQAAIAAAKADI